MSRISHPIPDAALASHLAILGKTGAGKSYAARSTVERILHRGERACIVDPTGVWWGLRLDGDGKARDGFPAVIAGGRHGDVPLSEGDGAALARIVGTTSTPMILDTSSLTVGARTRLFTAFAEALIVENVGPLHLVLDEAHLFAPQTRVPDPQSAMMVHAANSLVSLGRARGLRIMLLTQRPAKLHKDTLTQVETLVAMRLVAPQDRKAVEEWIVDQADKKRGAEIVASLPALRTGEAWVWSPDARILERAAFPKIVTFDSMRPEAQGARELLPVDIGAIRAALAPAGTVAEVTAARKASPDEIGAAEQRGYERGYAEGSAAEWRRGESAIRAEVDVLAQDAQALASRIEALSAAVATIGKSVRQPSLDPRADEPKEAAPEGVLIDRRTGRPPEDQEERVRRNVARNQRERDTVDLNSAGRKMFAVLDTNPPVRRSWTQVATLAGLKARGGHFNAGRKGLIDQAWVVVDGDLVEIRRPSTLAEPARIDPGALIDMWASNLSGAAPKILRYLHNSGDPVSKITAAADLGLAPRGGHWNAAWKELRDNALIVEDGETVRLADLFGASDSAGVGDA